MTAFADTETRATTETTDDSGTGLVARLRQQLRPRLATLVVIAALICWLASLGDLNATSQNQYGLMFAATPLYSVSIALVVAGFALAVRGRHVATAWFSVFASIAVLRLTVTLATAVPYYSWTYKHLGVVNYLVNSHGVPARDVDIYQHWVALFASTAWFQDVSGVSPESLAHWFTPVTYVLEAFLLYAAARAWDRTKMQAIFVAFIGQTFDWVGQSYYSPQWTAFLLALGVIILIGYSRTRPRYVLLTLMFFTALAITHQLTPYWLILLAGALAVCRKIKPWWLVLVFVAIAGGFLIYNYGSAAQFNLFHFSIDNAQSNVPTTGVAGQRFASFCVRALAIIMWLAAGLVFLVRLIRRQPVMAHACLALTSFVLLGGQNYGGEAIFRVFLYSIPGCAIMIAPVTERLLQSRRRISGVTVTAVACVLALMSGEGQFGNWYAFRMTPEEVSLSKCMINNLPADVYITPAAPTWPERATGGYAAKVRANPNWDQLAVEATSLLGTDFTTDAEYARISEFIQARGATPTYLVITQQMIWYDWYFGLLPIDSLYNLQARLVQDPKWKVVYSSATAKIYESNFFPTAEASTPAFSCG